MMCYAMRCEGRVWRGTGGGSINQLGGLGLQLQRRAERSLGDLTTQQAGSGGLAELMAVQGCACVGGDKRRPASSAAGAVGATVCGVQGRRRFGSESRAAWRGEGRGGEGEWSRAIPCPNGRCARVRLAVCNARARRRWPGREGLTTARLLGGPGSGSRQGRAGQGRRSDGTGDDDDAMPDARCQMPDAMRCDARWAGTGKVWCGCGAVRLEGATRRAKATGDVDVR